ncbi:hypothetical protein [Nostoc sp.]
MGSGDLTSLGTLNGLNLSYPLTELFCSMPIIESSDNAIAI